MHILRSKKFSFALMSHLSFVEYILNCGTCKHNMSVVKALFDKDMFPLSADMSYRCGSSHSDLFIKISAHKK